MNHEDISAALLILFDELKDDTTGEAQAIIQMIDSAKNDSQVEQGLRRGFTFLRQRGKNALADDLQKKCRGFVMEDPAEIG